ncbi:c-type cytochrome [Massilia sp. S19_KUP03_FR1]|uniref:c-type cytochrome n=1 Tax=Massilia sp. S19_KUP03_FR1 TaxID=3025503 RepID=UPI002FCCFD10
MRTWFKRAGIALLALVLLLLSSLFAASAMGERKRERVIAVAVEPIALSQDPAQVAQGRYLYTTRGCADCHGASGTGNTVFDDGGMLVVAPNITPHPGSAVARYGQADWVRSIRHGVKPNGQPILIMPSEDYNRLTDADLAALIVYTQQLPAAPGKQAVIRMPTPVLALYGVGAIEDAAEKIDHTLAPAQPVASGVTIAHGAYVANACIGCHGPQLSGGKIPGAPPAWPPAANLTPGPGSAMRAYPEPDLFMAMMRSGQRPDGSAISRVMPFASLGQMTDTDLRALHAYLRASAPRETGQR